MGGGAGPLQALTEALGSATRLGLCVSGGPDSMALVHVASQWARTRDASLVALHVAHGVRPGAPEEARAVKEAVEAMGVPCRVRALAWQPLEVPTHETLRAKRLDALLTMARPLGLRLLATAHHRDDAVETFVSRVHQASSLAGLAHCLSDRAHLWANHVREKGERSGFFCLTRGVGRMCK